jgi:N-acetylmuramoyl-L-alanine amidase
VIDPGHGGRDIGARGPDGTFEKSVTMMLAGLISQHLSDKYRTVLTRNDDYGLGIMERTSMANAEKAFLFVSIHTGGSYKYKNRSIGVFFLEELSDTVPQAEKPGSFTMGNDEIQVPWDEIQKKHLNSSREAAKTIHKRLSAGTHFPACRVLGAPLLVLKGADMPAVLIETGYLTDPVEEKKLNDKVYLKKLAREISRGIEDYFVNSQMPHN